MKRKLFLFFTLFLLVLSVIPVVPSKTEAASVQYLTRDLMTSSSSGDAYFDGWSRSSSFEDTTGNVIPTGVGFKPNYSYNYNMYANFKVEDYKYTTFEATLSIDNQLKGGDRGKTEFVIYADSAKLYSKTFTNTTKPENVKVQIPTGTKYISLHAVMTKGSQGSHGAIFGNARLTNSLKASNKVNQLALNDIGVATSKDFYKDAWSGGTGQPLEKSDGHLIGKGFGLSPGYSYTSKVWGEYKVSDYSYSTLETTVSLDKKWTTGDLGKTEVIIYADNVQLYSKTFTNTTPLQNLKLRLPKGTKSITFYAVYEKGNQGNHRVVFDNPVLTNSLQALPADDTVSLYDLKVSEGARYYEGAWGSLAFQMSEGSLAAKGFGLTPNYSYDNETYAKVYIGDYNHPTLETKISLDNKWRTGDRGKSTVYILMDNKVAYSKTFDNKTTTQNVIVNVPSKTKYVTFKVKHTKPSNSHAVIIKDPLLTNRPQIPTVNAVNNFTTKITGKAKASSTVTMKVGSKKIKEVKSTSKGTFTMTVPKQKAGTTLSFYVTDSKGRVSAAKNIKVSMVVSPKISTKNVSVVNNKSKADTITVKSLKKNDIVKIYNSKGKLFIKSKKATSSTMKLSIKQLGTKSGKVYVTLTRTDMSESAKIAVSYKAEKAVSPKISAKNVTVVNNKKKADTITVKGLKKNDVVKVYNSKGKLLIQSKKATSSTLKVSIKQLGTKSGKVYVTLSRTNMTESAKTAVSYKAEKK
ncbi:NPCBM/NEW2 domain-containing protein [Lederbergia panacisoli]|uniref:NPCBM/NEW2 domain-containing protein n=1 Tax=Lederbergia panacisoli TaxID=1255251 RepID=UPI00214C3885|nr:NPCBM/NEW2 domain-containing protein [Lederbergia panacisoli]MCR2821449.1 NPCBM/NEW2 domain-containing protein [Lederbergia panacisoli]